MAEVAGTTGATNADLMKTMEQMHQQQISDQIAMMKVKATQDRQNEVVQAVKAVFDRGSRNKEEMAKSLAGR